VGQRYYREDKEMGSKSFDEFVRQEQAAARISREKPVDWQAEKNAWLHQLDLLYAEVTGYLKPYEGSGVTVERRPIELSEDYIGRYSADAMDIIIGSKTITLEPVGTLLVGSKGRVEVAGPLARAQLLLLDSRVKSTSELIHISISVNSGPPAPPPHEPPSDIIWVWRIVTRPPRREILELNRDSFLNLLVEISNGRNI
jgi:hypothetical protein